MIDHFARAEALLTDTATLDPTLPFVIQKIARAAVHAQLATVQAFRADCTCGLSDFLRPEVTLTPKENFL